ncbi:hypothetical protein SBOR_8760 [Sclerotinia borealis F-4128]|uniref:Ubiquitin-like domain-containing protein n=1 Tax=Sclerotinia borealis (strain F-4128) TaxID=1432307 RepID=W9C571_SCLBF|nr:hypothetical protein SBOR_8760 [Sclerotinia borealis F-4128]
MSTSSSASSSRSASPELHSQTMQIFVKVLSGDSKSPKSNDLYTSQLTQYPAIPITVPENTTISNLSHLLSLRTSTPSSTLRLVHAGQHLLPSSTLTSNNITRDSTIHVSGTLRGGMPPKKIKCNYKDCGVAAQRIVGHCGFCEGQFCGKHRMLEDHKCVKLEDVSYSPTSLVHASLEEFEFGKLVLRGVYDGSGKKEKEGEQILCPWWQVGLADVVSKTMHEDGIMD